MTIKSSRRIGGVSVLLGFVLKVALCSAKVARTALLTRERTVTRAVWGQSSIWALVVWVSLAGGSTANSQDRWADNNMLKKRVTPHATTLRAGSAIDWEKRLDQALEKSAATGKPVFWYVPRLPDTFMDRVESIDFYMKAGPFSWPRIVDLINENFVPVAAVPTAAEQKKFGVETFKFIEPGILVLRPDRPGGNPKAIHVVDRLNTLHIPWLEHLITQFANHSTKTAPGRVNRATPELEQIWRSFSERNYRETVRLCQTQSNESNESASGVERDLVWAMAQFRMGQQKEATARFKSIAQAHPKHPLGQKASAEGQGIGPFVRGFEVHNTIPDAAYAVPDRGEDGSGNSIYGVPELRRRGVDYLLGMQNLNGGFFDSDYDFGGTDSLPNVHMAITSVVGLALLQEYRRTIEPDRKKRVAQAVVKAARFTADDGNLNLRDRDELFWAYAYRLELWTQIGALKEALIGADESKACIRRCSHDLVRIQADSGNWFHEYSNPFVTAMGVLALYESQLGDSDKAVAVALEKGCKKLSQQRGRDGAFPYDARSMGKRKPSIIGSAGRMPLCEAALWNGGKSSESNLKQAIETSFRFHLKMESAYKYDDHTSVYGYGGFFYWFDMRGRKQAIDLLPESDTKTDFQTRLRMIVVSKAEIDGCFVDSHEIGRCYGTAMALLCLGD